MKKFLLPTILFISSVAYITYLYIGGNGSPTFSTVPQNTTPANTLVTPKLSAPTEDFSSPSASSPPSTPTPLPAPTQKPKGQYTDGAYIGSGADAYYGIVQVQATINGSRLTDVSFLQYPNDRRTSQYINNKAMPLLRQEAIQAQSANVSGVSGASATSAAFRESLGSALTQAKN